MQIRGQVSRRNGERLFKAVGAAPLRGRVRHVIVKVTPTGGEVLKLRGFIWPRSEGCNFQVGKRMVPVSFLPIEEDNNLLFEVA